MSTKSISNLETRLTIVEATMKLLQAQLDELKSSGGSSVPASEKKEKKEKGAKKEKKETDPDAPKRERSDKQKAQDERREQIKAFLSDENKAQLKEAGYKGNVVFTISGYISEKNITDISAEVVAEAVKHLAEDPNYKSKTQKDRSEKSEKSEKSSVASIDGEAEKAEKDKKVRGRPKKEKVEKVEKIIEVVAPSEDDDNEKAEEWEFAGELFYKLTKSNAIIDMEFEYIGIYDGKKIDRKAEMPASVKKYLEQFD